MAQVVVDMFVAQVIGYVCGIGGCGYVCSTGGWRCL